MNSLPKTRMGDPLSSGFVLIDKPIGPTSHDMVSAVRRALGLKRVGHTGTLDPFASGLLLLFLGQGTRLVRFMAPLHKVYTGTLRLGIETDTLDSTGEVVSRFDGAELPTIETMQKTFAGFIGELDQLPPNFSAKKIDGVAAYKRARRGEDVKLSASQVVVYRLEAISVDGPDVSFLAEVGPGTYIRSIARDVGKELGLGGHLTKLRRTAIGPFVVDDAVSPEGLEGCVPRPLAEALSHLPNMAIDRQQREEIGMGKKIEGGSLSSAEDSVALTFEGELVAVAEPVDGLLQPRVVVAS